MGYARSIRNRGKRKKSKVFDLDITSLLDILVILLVFLLRSYNSSGIVLNVPKGVELPKSESANINSTGVMVQVAPDKIWVDDKLIIDNSSNGGALSNTDRRLIPLFNELVRKKNEIKLIEKTTPNAEKFSGNVNLIIDKSIKYTFIKKLMLTCAEAGFKSYKFVVLGEEQN
ncbi:transport energizing protein, ExbD/TolR family [Bacteriovorax sp. BSW11_IV]|uniref:biopolymer transporter ExbD n=1 Tax=Bacteriovorax sp. BSW11_IV TaxID=1353529 RepID=UPI00038A10EA|nr:biopolymer transporter ExbD [Bacteriovorax sp. BSW11_IV]EQC48355.1 transport energizing protein, ExbD/TolR family [Bacteriovorax sp. BSW11_IV]